MTRFVEYTDDSLDVTFTTEGEVDQTPFGSLEWFPTEVQVKYLSILGHDVCFDSLPVPVKEAILSLADNFRAWNWEPLD